MAITLSISPDRVWRPVDCELFDNLQQIIAGWRAGQPRAVAQIENGGLFPPNTIFASKRLVYPPNAPQTRAQWRTAWFDRVTELLEGCGIVFIDPDNSLSVVNQEDAFDWQRLPLYEANAISRDGERPTVIYHQFRRGATRGGMQQDIVDWITALRGDTYAFRVRRWVNRVFFVINPDGKMIARLVAFAQRWRAAECRWRNAGPYARRRADLSTLYDPDGREMDI